MKLRCALALAMVSAWLLTTPTATARQQGPVDRAEQLAQHGDLDGAIRVLRDHLKTSATDVQARVMLGHLLDFDGRPDEAVTLWEAGLTGAGADFALLMTIGEIRRRQGNDGPTIVYRRGMMGAMPSRDKAGEERYKKEHLAQAASAFEKARKLRPADTEAAAALASVYDAQGKPDAAIGVWQSVVQAEPRNASYRLALALAVRKAGRIDEALGHLKQAIELDPRLAEAHEALAEGQEQKGQAAEAEQSRKRAEFSKRLPSFATVAYSEENRKRLDELDQEATVRKLVDDPSDRAAEWLAILCWSHPHDALEARAFEALEARGEKTTPLLQSLLDAARSTCTIKSTAHILARRKADGLFDGLARMLPGDVRGFGMDMDIAGSLDDLGDPRAVGPLSRMLEPGDAEAAQEAGPLADRRSARARAALALGAFDTPEARRALEAGTRDAELRPFCLAALYRLTRDPKQLSALEQAVGSRAGYPTYLLGNYLTAKVGTDPARALALRWQARRKAEQEARAKQERAQPVEPPIPPP